MDDSSFLISQPSIADELAAAITSLSDHIASQGEGSPVQSQDTPYSYNLFNENTPEDVQPEDCEQNLQSVNVEEATEQTEATTEIGLPSTPDQQQQSLAAQLGSANQQVKASLPTSANDSFQCLSKSTQMDISSAADNEEPTEVFTTEAASHHLLKLNMSTPSMPTIFEPSEPLQTAVPMKTNTSSVHTHVNKSISSVS